MEDKIIETICKEEGTEYNYKFTVVGTFVGDEGETISQERILDVARMSDKSTAWEWLWNADFELEGESPKDIDKEIVDTLRKKLEEPF